jgi:hypothetical protein
MKKEIGAAFFIETVCQDQLLNYKEASSFLYNVKNINDSNHIYKGKLTYALLVQMNIMPEQQDKPKPPQ